MLHALGLAQFERGRYSLALEAFDKAVAAQENVARYHNDRAEALRALGRWDDAIASYRAAICIDPKYALAHFNLGTALQSRNAPREAERSYRRAIALAPDDAQAHHYLGTSLAQQGKTGEAIASYRHALSLDARGAPVYNDLGIALERKGDIAGALDAFQQAIDLVPTFAIAYDNAATLLQRHGDIAAAITFHRRRIEAEPKSVRARLNLGDALFGAGDQASALQEFEEALHLDPRSLEARLRLCIARLSPVYADAADILTSRERYRAEIAALSSDCDKPSDLTAIADAMAAVPTFYLAAQGCDDRDLQASFGSLAVRAFGARYPRPVRSAHRCRKRKDRIRVGIAASTFRSHTVWKMMIRGWAEQIDRNRFNLIAYCTRSYSDDDTKRALNCFDKFVQGPLSVERWAERIREDAVDGLIFPEIGMDSGILPLAALRHAPVQCASWGHPVTTGLETIDYFLTSDLMEPEDGQRHYTEQVVRLPNLGIYYERDYFAASEPSLADLARAKEMLSLPGDAVMYWSCQSIHKYLPQHDDIYPAIAARVPNARFVFIVPARDAAFGRRLELAFSRQGMAAKAHCTFLPVLAPHLFAAVSKLAHVYLDTIGWSGGNSTLENLAYDTPMVTLAGELMRSRHTAAILMMAGVADTIARSKEEYVDAAARLGTDADWRRRISARMAAGKARVYADLTPVRALEDFIQLRIAG